MGSPASPFGFVSDLGGLGRRCFSRLPPYVLSRGRPEPRPATLLRHPVVQTPRRRYGNIDPLRIGYASRPRLSSRLTLGGLAFPRKPWAYGAGVSRPRLATHASILTPMRSTARRPSRFAPHGKLPYHWNKFPVLRFGAALSPVYCRRMSTRPVSCYALFECMAASKPPSWLSGQTHILCHSARILGP